MMRTVSTKRFLPVAVICLGFFLFLQIAQSKASTSYAYTDQELDRLLAPIALYQKVQTGNGLMTICYLISNGCDAFVIPAHFLLIADGNTLKTRVIRIKGNCSRDPGGAI